MTIDAVYLLQEAVSDIRSEQDVIAIVKNDALFENYVTRLVSNLPKDIAPVFESYIWETKQYLTESVKLDNPQAYATTLAYFPVLAELYAKPVLSQLLTPWFTDNNGNVSVPLIKRLAQIIDGQGNIIKEYEIPKPIDIKKELAKTVTVNIDEPANLFELAKLDSSKKRIILPETAIVKVRGKDKDGNDVSTDVYLEIEKAFNEVGEINQIVKLGTGLFRINASINARTGEVTVGKTVISNPDNYTVESVDISFIATSIGTDGNLRVRYTIEKRILEKYVEPGIPHEVETDIWKDFDNAIFDINMLADLAQRIREQIALMKDVEVSNLIQRKESEIIDQGRKVTIDFANMPPNMSPANMVDVYTYLMTGVIKLSNVIYDQVYVQPNYLAINPADAHMVESFVEFASMRGGQISKVGYSPKPMTSQLTVLKSPLIPQGKMYLIAKPSGRENPVFIDAILRTAPLMVQTNIDVTKKITIIPNTKAIFIDPKKIGVIEIKNAPQF